MADWTDKDDLATYLRSQYYYGFYDMLAADTDWRLAWDEMYRGGTYDAAQQNMLDCLTDIIKGVKKLFSFSSSWYPECPVPYFLTHHTALTWKSICEAWAKDDFEGKEWTIACIDHMRKLMWDKPFRIIWASKPETEK